MSQEEKNARNLRLREARQKKKGAGCIIYLCSYIYYPVIWVGQDFMGCCQFVTSFRVPICYGTNSCISTCIYYTIYYRIQLTLVFDYVWSSEFQNPMETNSSRAPLGNLTNHTNGGN